MFTSIRLVCQGNDRNELNRSVYHWWFEFDPKKYLEPENTRQRTSKQGMKKRKWSGAGSTKGKAKGESPPKKPTLLDNWLGRTVTNVTAKPKEESKPASEVKDEKEQIESVIQDVAVSPVQASKPQPIPWWKTSESKKSEANSPNRPDAPKSRGDISVHKNLFDRLANSKFRSRFKLREKEMLILQQKGLEVDCCSSLRH